MGEDAENWKPIFGQVLDLYPGNEYVWAVNAREEIFACKQPCDTGDWRRIPGKATAVAVGAYYSARKKTTKGNESRVWIKNAAGTIFSRFETDTRTVLYWVDHSSSKSSKYARDMVPKRMRDLLNERDTMGGWRADTKYSIPDSLWK